ncbi:hypothetical protein [Leisingera aquaemixtae]|uniref:Uncharacterized protein n=1 Tax=Leisingera aquaemixtae TaxID=1396826 RepID=A0A0P1HEE0_9RHOB|nr:hypothetical protein [Leisingera aquaemixtae]CUI01881.1 hypothetical protein PHA8399_04030 [Leisingera aquaemixtae]
MKQDDVPEIPAYGDPEFDEALSALVRSADVMRKTLMLIVGAKADPERVFREHGEVLMQSEAVIQAWATHMGIEAD